MPLDPSAVAKWSASDWNRKILMLRPSDGGAQGVLFAFTWNMVDYKPALADFVVKPVTESAANTLVAERLLAKVANAKTPDSHAVSPTSSLGKAIIAQVDALAAKAGYPWAARMSAMAGHMRNANSLLIQRTASFKELGDVYRENQGFAGVLRDATLMKNLGRLYVADSVLGNGDRLDQMNTGNIAFDDDGNIVAIDSAALLTSFNALLRDAQHPMPQVDNSWSKGDDKYTQPRGFETELTREGWAHGTVHGSRAAPSVAEQARLDQGHAPRSVPTASMHLLFDPPAIWLKFRGDMELKMKQSRTAAQASGGKRAVPATPADWEAGRQPFIDGVLDGLKRVDTMLSGLSWLRTKHHFKNARSTHGGDANLSWTNFKMRRIIAQHAARGKSLDAAYAAAETYALRKTQTVDF